MGHLYKGGILFKKKAYISGFNSNKSPYGSDWRLVQSSDYYTVSPSEVSAADIDKYFFLPPLGYYDNMGTLTGLGTGGRYWTSSGCPPTTNIAYEMSFGKNRIHVLDQVRDLGSRVDPLFE